MEKRTWRFRGLTADVRLVMATAPSVSAAARQLGVDRSTLHRWARAGKIPALTRRRRAPVLEATPDIQTQVMATFDLRDRVGQHASNEAAAPKYANATHSQTVSWAARVRDAYHLNATEETLVGLAEDALVLARDPTLKPADRLSAMARFAQLVRQIDLEVPTDGHVETTPNYRPWPRRAV